MNLIEVLSPETALRGSAVFITGCAVILAMRRTSAAARHQVLLCTMAAALLTLFSAAVIPKWRVIPQWQSVPQAPATISVPPEMESVMQEKQATGRSAHLHPENRPSASTPYPIPAPAEITRSIPPRHLIAIIWSAGTAIFLVPCLGGMLALRRERRRATRLVSGPVSEMAASLADELGLRHKIEILISGRETMPMVWGIFRHCLLLPASAVEWSQERLRIVLLHELSHLKRRDPAALLIARLTLAFHWFNPLAWMANHLLRSEQETACDDLVLSHGITAPDYADEMLAFSSRLAIAGGHGPAPMMVRQGSLEKRIRGILDRTPDRRPLSKATALGTAFLAVIVTTPLAIVDAGEIVARTTSRGRILDRNGIVLVETKDNLRSHPFRALGVQVLGLARTGGSKPMEGTLGVEQSYDADLRLGKDITLTLDARIQSLAENTLREAGISRGALVILDPASGEVLASASVPSFDPDQWHHLLNQARQPDASFDSRQEFKAFESRNRAAFINRALSAQAPGSTFQLIAAAAAARTGLADRKYECSPVHLGQHQVNCWIYNKSRESHGTLDLHDALAQGCSSYFNKLSLDIGMEELSTTAKLLGFARQTGVDLPFEEAGTFGNPPRAEGGPEPKWSAAETCFTAMGQGNTYATPLQIAGLTATIANRGRIFTPHVNKAARLQAPVNLADHKVGGEAIRNVRTGMEDFIPVFKRAQSTKVAIAGKTGLAQIVQDGRRSHAAWFTGYAPAAAPRYAITVMVENAGSGVGVCGPIARRILEALTEQLPPPVPQEPIDLPFERIEEVDL